MLRFCSAARGRHFLALLAIACCAVLSARPAYAIVPEDPEVKKVIEKALSFLAKSNHEKVGGKCLIALAFKKNGRDNNFGKIKEAIEASTSAPFAPQLACDNYNLPLMIIFLIEMESEQYRPRIQQMLTEMLRRQQSTGGWGYEGSPQGDTSQTQYAVLAMWFADRHGYDVPVTAIGNAMNWLLRTQDPSGTWGYQGVESTTSARVPQEANSLTMSLGAAALGSMYIMKELVILPGDDGIANPAGGNKPGAEAKRPTALQLVEEKKKAAQVTRRRPAPNVDGSRVRKSMQDGNAWMAKNFTVEPPKEWKHYAFYAYERYATFKDAIDGDAVEEPKWFTDIFNNLQKTQHPDGSWEGGDTPVAATAFGVLVLSRSTQKAFKRAEMLGEGIMLGGMGLPKDVVGIKERNGKLVSDTPLTGKIDDLLNILEDNKAGDLLDTDQPLQLDADITRRSGQITKLRAMVSAESFETRLVAVRSLAQVRELDNVPVLLYALSDPDIRVVRVADRGLRFISRKLEGVMPIENGSKETKTALRQAWGKWYLSIRPDAELLD